MRPVRQLTLLLALVHGVLIFALAWMRFSTCHNHTFDLALYARSAWGLAHGDFWNPITDSSLVHLHAAWILLPLGVLGRIFGTVPVLLLAQAVAIAACAWPLARVGERHLGRLGELVAVVAWIAYPNLGHVGSYEMHPGSLALLPLCFALDALDRNDPRGLMLSTLGVLACRADYALLTAMAGLLLATGPLANVQRTRTYGFALAGGSIVYLMCVLGLQRIWPGHGTSSALLHFGAWGGSPLGFVTAVFTHPSRVFDHVLTFDRISYVPRILLPLALLPLLSPRWLWVAAPIFALNLISHWPTVTRLDSHYLSPALPALIVGALVGLARVRARWPGLSRGWIAAPLVACVGWGGLPWSLDFDKNDFLADARSEACAEVVMRVPQRASVQAPDSLLPHLAERAIVHRSPPTERGTDYVVLDASHRQRFAQREDLLRTVEEPLLRTWLARADHGLVHMASPWLLLQRGQPPRSGWPERYFAKPAAEPGTDVRLTACLSVTNAQLRASTLQLGLRAHAPCPPDLAIRIGANRKPTRVDLLFDGALSPAHLRAGDSLMSTHKLTGTQVATMDKAGLWVGALRTSGARPAPTDPITSQIPVKQAP